MSNQKPPSSQDQLTLKKEEANFFLYIFLLLAPLFCGHVSWPKSNKLLVVDERSCFLLICSLSRCQREKKACKRQIKMEELMPFLSGVYVQCNGDESNSPLEKSPKSHSLHLVHYEKK